MERDMIIFISYAIPAQTIMEKAGKVFKVGTR